MAVSPMHFSDMQDTIFHIYLYLQDDKNSILGCIFTILYKVSLSCNNIFLATILIK